MAVSISGEGVISGSSSYSFDSNVSIAGTTTIEDVTSVDSVGIITAQSGIHVTSGNVGIGTDNPPEKLSIENGNIFIRDASDNESYIYFTHSPTANRRSYIGAVEGTGNSNSLVFATNGNGLDGAERLRITSSGKVGIGTDISAPATDAILTAEGVTALTNLDQTVMVRDKNTDDAIGRGGNIGFGAYVNDTMRTLGGIGALKSVSGSTFSGDLALYTRVNGQTNLSERLRITSDGKVGINTTSPNATLTVGSVDSPGFNRGSVAIKALTDANSLPTNIYLEEESGAEGYQLSIDSNGDLNFHNSGAADPTVTFSDDNKVGINSTIPAQALDVVGRISKTEYEPGEIIEQISSFCDGSSHTVKSGTYTMTNVTAEQTGSTSDATASGSTISYTPPLGTKRIHYQYWFKWEATENSGISHFFIQVDGNDVVISRRTKATNYSRYSSTYYHHGEEWYCMSCVLECDASSTDTSEGQYAGWAANQETKDIRVRFREYSGSYEISLHGNQYWDGASASGTNQKPIKPMLIVTAIA